MNFPEDTYIFTKGDLICTIYGCALIKCMPLICGVYIL